MYERLEGVGKILIRELTAGRESIDNVDVEGHWGQLEGFVELIRLIINH